QLDSGDAQPDQVGDDMGIGQGGEGAALVRPDFVELPGQPFDVGLVDDRTVPWHPRVRVAVAVEMVVHHHAPGHGSGAVATVVGEVGARRVQPVSVQRVGPPDLAVQHARVRIDQQFVVVETVATLGRIGAIHTIAIQLPAPHVVQIAMPYTVGAFGQHVAGNL